MLYAEVDVSGINQDSVKRHFIKTICTTLVEMQNKYTDVQWFKYKVWFIKS